MLNGDNSCSEVRSAVAAVKSAVKLDPNSQSPKYSGHASAPSPAAASKSQAVPAGSPGK